MKVTKSLVKLWVSNSYLKLTVLSMESSSDDLSVCVPLLAASNAMRISWQHACVVYASFCCNCYWRCAFASLELIQYCKYLTLSEWFTEIYTEGVVILCIPLLFLGTIRNAYSIVRPAAVVGGACSALCLYWSVLVWQISRLRTTNDKKNA